jgi:hypothetical protein
MIQQIKGLFEAHCVLTYVWETYGLSEFVLVYSELFPSAPLGSVTPSTMDA